jgi:hypothetical protein
MGQPQPVAGLIEVQAARLDPLGDPQRRTEAGRGAIGICRGAIGAAIGDVRERDDAKAGRRPDEAPLVERLGHPERQDELGRRRQRQEEQERGNHRGGTR